MKKETVKWYEWQMKYYQTQMAILSTRCSQYRREIKLLQGTLKELKKALK